MKTKEQYLQENIHIITNYIYNNPFSRWTVRIDNYTIYSYSIKEVAEYWSKH